MKAIREAEKTSDYMEFKAGLISEKEYKSIQNNSMEVRESKVVEKVFNQAKLEKGMSIFGEVVTGKTVSQIIEIGQSFSNPAAIYHEVILKDQEETKKGELDMQHNIYDFNIEDKNSNILGSLVINLKREIQAFEEDAKERNPNLAKYMIERTGYMKGILFSLFSMNIIDKELLGKIQENIGETYFFYDTGIKRSNSTESLDEDFELER